ncbi:MAG: PIN domain-containing protein [Defluviitaleaceae bacterium]|nr:PIN domain-containing protein [Defluviitaleaceae bacterium]
MSGRVFLDTNVFVYTQSEGETIKRDIALNALDKYDCCTSTQVFNEISNVMIKKLKMSIAEVKQIITAINSRCEVGIIDFETVQKALDLKGTYGYSYYDSLIIAAAILNDCDYIFSEDLHDGQIIDNKVEIANIFKRRI